MLKIFIMILCLTCIPVLPVWSAPRIADLLEMQLIINLPGRTIELYSGNRLIKRYPVAIGKPSTPTPIGNFFIQVKEINPAWYPPETPGKVVPSGPYNPLGYRWMGFLPTYGIHGTNNPDSIGLAVSNGCVRMFESDVEELYELVKLQTPLQISYERIRVGVDEKNRPYIALYPDVYGWQPVSIADMREKLYEYNWDHCVDDTVLKQMLQATEKTEYILPLYHLIVNGKMLSDKIQLTAEGLLIPVQSVANAVKANIVWDEEAGQVRVGSYSFPGIQKGSTLYAALDSIPVLFGGSQQADPAKSEVKIEILSLTLNGKSVLGDFPLLRDCPLLPVLTLQQILDKKVVWDEKKQELTHNSKIVPVEVINNKPYLPINQVYSVFGAYVYWEENARIIDLTYPFQKPDED